MPDEVLGRMLGRIARMRWTGLHVVHESHEVIVRHEHGKSQGRRIWMCDSIRVDEAGKQLELLDNVKRWIALSA